MSRKPKVQDITVRLRRKDGQRASRESAKKALWVAHLIARSGGSIAAELREWTIEAVDWRSGKKTYHYGPADVDEVIGNMGGILEKVGMAGIGTKQPGGVRLEVPNEEGEQ